MSKDFVPSHALALWLMREIDRLLDAVGLARHAATEMTVYVAVVAVLSFAIGWATKRLVIFVARKVVRMRGTDIGRELLQQHTLSKCSHVVPPLVLMGLLPFALEDGNRLYALIERLASLYMLVAFGVCLTAILNFCFMHYNAHANTRNLPIKGVLNIAKGAVWLVVLVIGASIVTNKSPAAMLTGLGAFAAALLLIFKDSILGFVAGLQMSQNDMLHVGDWIEVPSTPANGIVIDVSLTAVKVQNLDNTIVTVPPYTLVSTSFRNYRGMYDSNVRRILQTLLIDVQSVAASQPDERTRADTNLGLFRLYLMDYLKGREDVAAEERLMVSVTQESQLGLLLQIYCFCRHTDWLTFERVQSEIMEHVALTARAYGLRLTNIGELRYGQEKSLTELIGKA